MVGKSATPAQQMASNDVNVEELRDAVLKRVLRLYAAFGALLAVWSVSIELSKNDFVLAGIHTLLYSLLLFIVLYRRLPHRARTALLVFTLLGVALSEYVLYGPFGEGAIFLVSALALVTLMIGKRAGYVSVALAVATLIVVAALHSLGVLTIHWLGSLKADQFSQWLTTLIEVSVFCSALNYTIATLFEQLVSGLEAKKESESRYRLLADHVGDVIWTVDPEFRCTYISPSAKPVLGRSPETVLGRDLRALGFTALTRSVAQYAAPLKNSEGARLHSEQILAAIRHGDGREIPTETVLSVLQGDAGETRGLLGVTRDISARVRLEQERERLEDQLRHSQRMESIGQLAGGIAHDLNNLLQGMLAYAELAHDKVGRSDYAQEDIAEIVKGCERSRDLVRQLLAFGRRQVLELRVVNPNELIGELVNMIRRVIGEPIVLEFIEGADLATVEADRGQLEQVLMNLCINARDAMPEGGTLRIETRNADLEEGLGGTRESTASLPCVLICVSDTGCGMDEATQRRLFEPFFTTKETGKGTGLGLSTVFGIVRQHNGLITVESAPGAGSTFRIYLPRTEAKPTERPRADVAASGGGTETILFADDNETVRRVTELTLRGVGYTVLSACDGEEAIRLYNEQSADIDLALLDVVMPGLGGDAVARHISAHRPELPILFCSGYTSEAVHTNYVLDEGTQLLRKPYRREELLNRLRESLNGKLP